MKKVGLILLIGSVVACTNPQQEVNSDSNVINNEEIAQQKVEVKNINTEDLKELISAKENLQLVDVRTPNEISQGYIGSAILDMDFMTGEFQNKISTLEKTKPIVVYCASGGRSAKAAEILLSEGFQEVYNYKDGYSGWASQ